MYVYLTLLQHGREADSPLLRMRTPVWESLDTPLAEIDELSHESCLT